jgi:hypothetical protein
MSDKKIKQYYSKIIKEALKEVERRQNSESEMLCYKYKKAALKKGNYGQD